MSILLVSGLDEPKVVEELSIRVFASKNVEAFVDESLLFNVNFFI